MSGISDNSHQNWATLAHTTGAAAGHDTCMVGVWDPVNLRFLDGTTAALGLISPQNIAAIGDGDGTTWAGIQDGTTLVADTDGIAAGDEAINVLPTSPQWLNRAFQIVQAMPSGNPIASPIIHTNQVKRLRWDPNNEPVLHKITAQASDLGTVAVGDTLQLVLVMRFPGDITRYEAQINPSGSGTTNVTPAMSAAFDNPKRIYRSAEYVCATTTGNDEHNAFADLVIADNASGKNSFSEFITTTLSTNDLVLEAKFQGQIIEAFVVKNGEKNHTCAETAAPELGVGSFAEVQSAYKKAQYSQGFFNRMYLPTGDVQLASTTPGGVSATQTAGYDRLFIEYENYAGKMPGFNKQGNCGSITLYVPNATYANQDNGLAVEATFGLIDAAGGSKEYVW